MAVFNILGKHVYFDHSSGWYVSGVGWSAQATKSIDTPIPGLSASVGGTVFSFIVKNKSHEADAYICHVSALVVGASFGTSYVSFGSVSIGPASFDSGGIHPFLRQPGAPGPEGEPGDPSGFLGPCLCDNASLSKGFGTGGVTVLMLGATLGLASLLSAGNNLLARYAAFKYSGAFWSTGINITPAISIDATMNLGIVTHYDRYTARRGDNKMIKQYTTAWGPLEGIFGG